jgi:hypothetical protein
MSALTFPPPPELKQIKGFAKRCFGSRLHPVDVATMVERKIRADIPETKLAELLAYVVTKEQM